MGEFTLLANQTGLFDQDRPTTPVSSEATAEMWRDYALFSFAAPASNLYKRVVGAKVGLWIDPGHEENNPAAPGIVDAEVYTLLSSFDPATMTSDNRPQAARLFFVGKSNSFSLKARSESALGWSQVFTNTMPDGTYYSNRKGTALKDIIRNGVMVRFAKGGTNGAEGMQFGTSLSASHKPCIVVEYSNDTVGLNLASASPISGYIPKSKNRTFRWSFEPDGVCAGTMQAETVKFRWREKDAVNYTEVNCGSAGSYTLSGASITADAIEWQLEATDSAGTVTTTSWYTLSTVEALSTAVAESPKDIMVDGSSDNVFRWSHLITTGTAPTSSELQISTDGSTWTALTTVSGSALETTIQAGTLTAGEILWRVRTCNTDNAAGSWSAPASILVVAAPADPTVSVDQTPRPLISWQSSGQQGYQIRIAGVWESGSAYGVENSRKLPVILPDGDYIVEVRVVNEYGLWSGWGSAPLTVANTPGDAISLTAAAPGEIYLSWSTTGSYTRFLVERDGVPIALTADAAYIDHRAVGAHSYRVLGLSDGSDDYTPSNIAAVDLTVEVNSITDLQTGETLELRYSTTQIREEQIVVSRKLKLTHFSGAAYPTAELGEDKDRSLKFEAAFADQEQGRALEALVGRLVCLKAQNNEMVVGVLGELKKTSSAFWVDYSGTLDQIDEEEVVEL